MENKVKPRRRGKKPGPKPVAPICHPSKPAAGRGFCKECYDRWHWRNVYRPRLAALRAARAS